MIEGFILALPDTITEKSSAVMIRFIEEQDGKMFFKSGGGITCKSDLESEYNEMKQKVYVPIY